MTTTATAARWVGSDAMVGVPSYNALDQSYGTGSTWPFLSVRLRAAWARSQMLLVERCKHRSYQPLLGDCFGVPRGGCIHTRYCCIRGVLRYRVSRFEGKFF